MELLPVERRLLIEGRDATIGARAFDVLLALIERRDRLVSRDELLDVVWPDTAVEPNNLAVQVGALRKLLGPQRIATIPGRGYRFAASVDEQATVRTMPDRVVAGRTNLPESPSPLIGRDDDLRAVADLLDVERVVTVVGAGGIGKTRLAQRLLHDRRDAYRHGVCWVELGSIDAAAALPGVIAGALGMTLAGAASEAVLEAAVAPLEILIALDNAEHLLVDVARIVAALDERLQILTGGYRSAPARQQTMRAALEWSHQLLGSVEQIVFRRLAVVAGSASLELIQAIVAGDDEGDAAIDADAPLDPWTVVDAVAGLVDRSLVALADDDRDPDRPRYRLLETPRAYAVERLAAAGEVSMVEARHAQAMATLLAQAWVDRWSGRIGFRDWIDRNEADRDNARLAFAWALRRGEFDAVLAMTPVLLRRSLSGSTYDGRLAIAEAVDAWLATQPPAPAQLAARTELMRFWSERDLPRSLVEARDAMTIAEACDDRFAAYFIEAWSVRIHVQMRNLEAAAAALERVDALEDPAWPAVRLTAGAEARSAYHFVAGPPGAALEPCRRELRLARLAGYDGEVVASNLVAMELETGDFAAAAANASKLIDELGDSRNQYALLLVRINLVGALLAQGDVAQARPVAKTAWQVARYFELHGDCADHLALMCAIEGRWTAAAMLVGYADAVYARRGAQRWPSEKRARDQAADEARDALGDAAFERLVGDGARLDDADVAALVFDEA